MSSAPFAELPSAPPDFVEGSPIFRRHIQLWVPREGQAGLLVMDRRHTMDNRTVLSEEFRSVRLQTQSETPVAHIVGYLGITSQVERTSDCHRERITLTHPAEVDRLLQALPMPDHLRPPGVTPYPGEEFSNEAEVEELANNGRFLMATQGHTDGIVAHDLITHFLGGRLYATPNHMDRLQQRAIRARKLGRSAMTDLCDDMESFFIPDVVLNIVDALQHERGPDRAKPYNPDHNAAWYWKAATHFIARATGVRQAVSEVPTADIVTVRNYVYALGAAAKQATPAL